jgi:hypothetical protein
VFDNQKQLNGTINVFEISCCKLSIKCSGSNQRDGKKKYLKWKYSHSRNLYILDIRTLEPLTVYITQEVKKALLNNTFEEKKRVYSVALTM